MGLDIVELVMAVEETFDIHLADEKLCEARTVGDLYDLVFEEIRRTRPVGRGARHPSVPCATSRAFYRLRKGLVESVGVERREVTPSAALEVLIPRKGRRPRWNSLASAVKCALPRLVRPVDLTYSLLTVSALASVSPIVVGHIRAGGTISLCLASGAALFMVSMLVTKPLAVEFGSHLETVGDLARHLSEKHWARFAGWELTDEEVWERLRQVFVEQQGLALGQITRDASIVGDLGIE